MFSQWLSSVFSHPDAAGALVIAAKTSAIYLFLVIGLRLLGKRTLGQMSLYDLILIVVIANSVQNAMVGEDTTLVGGIVAAITLLILNRAFTWTIIKSPGIKHWLIGEPVLILRDGRLLDGPMRKEGITRDHVMAAMREHGIGELEEVQMAVLEADGSISIVAKGATVNRSRRRFKGLRVT